MTIATEFDKFRLRLLGIIGIVSLADSWADSITKRGRPLVSDPNIKASLSANLKSVNARL